MNELQVYIKSYFGIQNENLIQLANFFTEEKLQKGEFHTKQGSYYTKLSFIKKGFLRIHATHKDKEITQWISSQGEFVADLAGLMFESPARWNIEALTDCELYTISAENYRNIGQIIPEWDKLEKLFLSKCFLTIEDRVFSFLSMSAEERYQHLFQNKKELFNQVPLNYLASMLGMTPETFSRIRKRKSGAFEDQTLGPR